VVLQDFDGPEPKLLKGEDVLSEVVDVASLFAFIYKEQLLASLDALVSEEADDAAATHEVRQQRESEVLGVRVRAGNASRYAMSSGIY
jgi:hypothetical protein